MPTRQIFNAATQQVEDAELTVDQNNEIVATFTDGSFLKFPAGMSTDDFTAQVEAVQTANEGQEVITPEVMAAQEAERAASLALIGETPTEDNGNTMPAGDPTDVPATPDDPAG